MKLAEQVLDWVTKIGSLVVSSWLGYYFAVRLFQRQKKANREIEQMEIEKKRVEIEKLFDERWKALSEAQTSRNAELELQIMRMAEEHIVTLKDAKADCSHQISVVEENHKIVVKKLQDSIRELERKVKGLEKINTDKLKKDL